MFDKRILKELPEGKVFVYRQVLCQWVALLTNISFTLVLCFLFVSLINQKLNYQNVLVSLMIFLVLFTIRSIALKKANHYSFQGACLIKTNLRQRLFEKILSLGHRYQDYVTTSELVQLSVEGINQLETYFSLYLPQLIYSLLAPMTLFITIAFFDLKCAILLLICVPLIPVSIILVQKIAKKLLSKYWSSYTTLGDSFLENLQGLTTLKIYQSDDLKHQQMNEEAENFRKITMKVLIMQLNSISIMDIVAYGGAILGSYFAIMQYHQGVLDLFGTMFIILVSFEFFIPLRQLGSFFHIAMNGIAASDKIFKVLDIENNHERLSSLENNDIDVQVKDLSFSYDQKRQVLNQISFDIKPHQFVGIVGESGSGKSTIAKILMGYHAYQGNVIVQGKERDEINDASFMNHVCYITHDPIIFKGTLRDNLDFLSQYDDEKLWDVLNQVKLKDYFETQQGLETLILESGSNLSGGQKQRLNLARALLKDVQLYVFDEATSHIDVESEETILDIISQLSLKCTVLMITHRLSSVQNCHNILVMKDGSLIEQGTHQELMNQKGHYSKMLNSQKELEVYYS